MESIKQSMDELALHFHSKMAEFQQNLQSAIPATSPSSNIAAQFSTFRSFVLTSMESLQIQIKLLSKHLDQLEMRSRRKILLVHGIPEEKKENVSAVAIKVLSQHLKLPELLPAVISRSHRMGHNMGDKPRPILIKFQELSIRNKIWYSKINLKNTGITLSEFLTKNRHDAFMAARQQFGVSKCWTKEGQIVIIGPDGARHHITSTAEISSILSTTELQDHTSYATTASTVNLTNTAAPAVSNSKGIKTVQPYQATRAKRNIKK